MLRITISLNGLEQVTFIDSVADDIKYLVENGTQYELIAKDFSFSYIIDYDNKIIGVELYVPYDSPIASFIKASKDCIQIEKGSFIRIWFLWSPKHYQIEDPEFGDRYYYSGNLNRLIILLPVFCFEQSDFLLPRQHD